MVTRQHVVSDISGEPDATTTTLGLDAEWRAVDLTQSERAELDALLRPYLSASRRHEPTAPRLNRFVPKTTPDERAAIRRWARLNGFELADRGMIPRAAYTAYREAHEKVRL